MLQIQIGEERKSSRLNNDDNDNDNYGNNTTTTVIILSLCHGVQNISFTFHVFMVYNHLKLLLKRF